MAAGSGTSPVGCLTQPAGHQDLTSFREEGPWWGIQLRFTVAADTRLHSVRLMTHWGLLTHWGHRKVVSKCHLLGININHFRKKYTTNSAVPGSCNKFVYWNDPLITGVIVINSHWLSYWFSHWHSHWLSLTLSLTPSLTLTDSLTDSHLLSHWLSHWLADWITDWLAGSLIDSLSLTH